MRNLDLAKQIVDFANIKREDLVVEVGPGRGILTRLICENHPRCFVAIEIDARLNPVNNKYIHIIGDFLTLNICAYLINENYAKIITNLPYHITKRFFEKVIGSYFHYFEDMIVMLQYEFKENFQHSSTAFTRYVKSYYDIDYLLKVHRTDFRPEPTCDSYVFRFRRKTFHEFNCQHYYDFLKHIYKFKRKILDNNDLFVEILENAEFSHLAKKRIEQLSEDEVILIYNAYLKHGSHS